MRETITQDEVKQAQQAWADAVVSGDPNQVMALYAANAVLKPTLSDKIRKTPDAIKSYFEGTPGNRFGDHGFLKKGWTEVRFIESNPFLNGNTAVDTGKYTFVGPDGTETTADYTFAYYKNGTVKIVRHHSSLEYKK